MITRLCESKPSDMESVLSDVYDVLLAASSSLAEQSGTGFNPKEPTFFSSLTSAVAAAETELNPGNLDSVTTMFDRLAHAMS